MVAHIANFILLELHIFVFNQKVHKLYLIYHCEGSFVLYIIFLVAMKINKLWSFLTLTITLLGFITSLCLKRFGKQFIIPKFH